MPKGRNFHLRTDIEDFHIYFAIPDHYHKWASWTRDFSTHPSWTFSYHGDAERTGQEPLLVSEFGNWGLPTLKDLLTDYGEEPTWFRTGEDATQPHGVQRRFNRFHLDEIFGSYDQFAIATQWHQYAALKYEIEEMRKYRSIAGYVITEFTDLHWEANGLLNIWRRPKVFHHQLAQFQQDDILFAGWQRLNYWEGDLCNVEVWISHFSGRDLRDYVVEWNISDLREAGYRVVEEPDGPEGRAEHAILCRIDERAARFLQTGGRALFLVRSSDDISPDLPERDLIKVRDRRARMDIRSRERNPWEGDW